MILENSITFRIEKNVGIFPGQKSNDLSNWI
jgi:hypothetical protein